MSRRFVAGAVVAAAAVAGAFGVATSAGYLPWHGARESASAGGTAPQRPQAGKLCRTCGVVREIAEASVRGEAKRYDITVRTEDGLLRIVSTDTQPAWRVGDRVRVTNGKIAAL